MATVIDGKQTASAVQAGKGWGHLGGGWLEYAD